MTEGLSDIMGSREAWLGGAGAPGAPGGAGRFDATLRSALEGAGREADVRSVEARARETAEEFVAVALVEPVLKQLRETNNAAGPFSPGPAERQFGPLLDGEIARRVTGASNFGLVERLARDLRTRSEGLAGFGAARGDATDA